jgi:site-specific DNA recombinase
MIRGGHDVASPVNLLLSRLVPMQMKRRGVEMRMVLEGDSTPNRVDLPLLKAVARARRWAGDLVSGKARSVGELARREGIDGRSVRRLIPLGFLSPRIIEAIAEGTQPVELTVEALTRRIDLPLLWSAQEQALGIE